jgi:rfaE bifunctional protein nucleotidyltransferase chain/domain
MIENNWDLVPLERERIRKKVVFTNGCFDLLHVGHIKYLKEAKALGDILVVGLNSDKSVYGLKGDNRPLQKQEDRAEILLALKMVDYVFVFDDTTPINLIRVVHPDILVKGGDWPVDKIVGADFVQSYGGLVKTLQFVEGHSTTAIIEKMSQS